MKYRWIFGALLLTAGCADIPQDPGGTLERVRSEGSFRVGLIAAPAHKERQQLFLRQVGGATGATPVVKSGTAERLLLMLEAGELDLVLGPMAAKSPWRKRVTFLPPLAGKKDSKGPLHTVAMAKHGENAWIGLLYRQASEVAAAR